MQYTDSVVNKPVIYLRCDAGPDYGYGHFMRCVSLAQAFHRSGMTNTVFLTRKLVNCDAVAGILRHHGWSHCLLPESATGLNFHYRDFCLPEEHRSILIVDNYDVTSNQMALYMQAYGHLVLIDDLADRIISADMVINQNLNAGLLNYQRNDSCTMLLGPSYALLRENFLCPSDLSPSAENRRPSRQVFMSFGGGRIVERIDGILNMFRLLDPMLSDPLTINFALPSDSGQESLIKARLFDLKNIKLRYIVGEYDLSETMRNAEFAITAAGSSVFELACLGIPQMAIVMDKNQEVTGNGMQRSGFGICLGPVESLTRQAFFATFLDLLSNDALRKSMACRGREYVDGLGADRVVEKIRVLYGIDGESR